ncbi:MAG: D-glycero-beta-D-manno-heptose 1-phosphate adenylyltransferase, partial [Alphaproteobacteria bacterium]|nr:D-glycero-beta-D-manno-heptose 1-phosphate adenylyltransferase [Alphaproteobacteria bacterium]
VYDVPGAGDTVIATFASALAADAQQDDAARLANIAAGIAVGKPGTATVAPDELFEALDMQAGTRKIVTAAAAGRQAERWRGRGLKVGFTNGTFDLLHPGHLSSIRQAKAACDRLVVAINSDASVKRYKGPTRPIQDQKARADILAALEMVDMVVVFEEDTPIELLKTIRPDVLVKGGQYKLEEVVGYDIVMGYGGTIVRADMEDGFSTTNTIEKMAG